MCGHRQHAEPSTTEAQRLQGPRTRDEPKTEENVIERVSLNETDKAGMTA